MRRLWLLGLFLGLVVSQDTDVAATTSPGVCAAEKTAAHKKVVCTPVAGVDKSPSQACNTCFSSTTGCDATPTSTTISLALPTLTARCGPESCVSCKKAGAKRDFEANLSQTTPVAQSPYHRLEARAPKELKDYEDNFDKFMVGEVKKAEDDGMLVPLRRGDRKMEGCTSIAVTSRRGLWLSHIWENPSMNKQDKDGDDRFLGRDVLTGIFTGDHTPKFPGLTEFTNDKSYFNHESYGGIPNKVQPIIYTPRRRPEQNTEEGKKILKADIEKFGGPDSITSIGLDPESDEAPSYLFEVTQIMEHMMWHFKMFIKVHTYIQVDVLDPYVEMMGNDYKENILETTANGKVLVQYDPGHCPNAGEPPNKAQVKVYMSGSTEPIYHDEWDAMPDQSPAPAAQGAAQKPLIAVRDERNGGYVCVHHNTTTSSTSTSKSASATLPAITSCSPLAGGNPGNPKQTQCACNDDLLAVLSSSTKSDGATTFWCGAGKATVSVNAPMPQITSCSPLAGGNPGNPKQTQCACNDDMVAILSSSSKSDGATAFWCGAGKATVSVKPPTSTITACSSRSTGMPGHTDTTLCDCNGGQTLTARETTGSNGLMTLHCFGPSTTVAANTMADNIADSVLSNALSDFSAKTHSQSMAAGASAVAGILGGLKPTTTVSFSPPLVMSSPEPPPPPPPPVVVVVTSTKKPEPKPTPKPKAFKPGQCAMHIRRSIRAKDWPEGPNINVAHRVYDGSDKLMHEYEQSGEFNDKFVIKQSDTKLDHDIEIRYDEIDQTCVWNKSELDQHKYDWAIQCRYQNFAYGSEHWRAPNGPDDPKNPVRPYCKIGKWDTASQWHTQDMDCFFTC